MSKNILNIIGLRCPETLMKVRQKIRTMKKKETILIITDDFASLHDIPDLCRFMQHTIIKKNVKKLPYTYLLKK